MDNNTIAALSQILDDHMNKRSKRSNTKKRINHIFHNKKSATVIRELSIYIPSIVGKYRNNFTLITVMALILRNSDYEEIKKAIMCYKLTGHLYGGLYILFTGKSENFAFNVNLNDSIFENKYAFITRFLDFNYWDYFVVFQTVELLSIIDIHRFEQLALADETRLLLLNMCSHHLDIIPSERLIHSLIEDSNELYQNIGFHFLARSITRCITDYDYIQKAKKNGLNPDKKISAVRKETALELEKCFAFLDRCSKRTQASLLTNYLLVHQNVYPICFARTLMHSDLQEEFVYQIGQTGKVRSLKDVSVIIALISNTPSINDLNKRISKSKLYESITTILIEFIEKKKGIYGWDEQQSNYITYICQRLPPFCIKKLKKFLAKKETKLLSNKLDELVRFHLFLEDKQQHSVISGIASIIDSLTIA